MARRWTESEPESEPFDEGYEEGYNDAYTEGYEEGYEEAAAADGPVGPVVVAELAAKSLAVKKEQVLHAIASPVPAAASVV